jgi:hypothetical protein
VYVCMSRIFRGSISSIVADLDIQQSNTGLSAEYHASLSCPLRQGHLRVLVYMVLVDLGEGVDLFVHPQPMPVRSECYRDR